MSIVIEITKSFKIAYDFCLICFIAWLDSNQDLIKWFKSINPACNSRFNGWNEVHL